MLTKLHKILIIIAIMAGFSFTSLIPNEEEMRLIGTWEYIAPSMGFGYQKGDLIFTYENDQLTGNVLLGEEIIPMRNLIFEDHKVRAYIMVQGAQVNLFLRFEEDSFEGTVSNHIAFTKVAGFRKKMQLTENN